MKVHTRRQRRRAGFTLTEILVTVGILAVLLAVAVPSIFYYRRELKLTELDDNARAVFMAAQNHLTALRSASVGEKLEVSAAVGRSAKKAPDAVSAAAGAELLYVSTDEGGAEPGWLVLPGAIEGDLSDGSYLVEFDPASGSVYGVFFMEKSGSRTLNAVTYQTLCEKSCRTRDGREAFSKAADGFLVGYYGADGALEVTRPDAPTLPAPKLKLVNAEELRLYIDTDLDGWTGLEADKVFASVSVSDGTKAKTLVKKGRLSKDTGVSMVLDTLKTSGYEQDDEPGAANWSKVGGSFAQWMKDGSGYTITPGANITVTVSIWYQPGAEEGVAALPQTASVTTNSLFAARPEDSKVEVAYGRHLQNLGSLGVDSAVTAAVQVREIDFAQAGDGIYSWEDTYGHDAQPFVPIENSHLDSYDGAGLAIRSLNAVKASGRYENAGLFGAFSGSKLENVVLIDAKVNGSVNAGTLAGTAKNTTVDGCQVYLTAPTAATQGVNGSTRAGGLFGAATNCTIQNGTFASTMVRGGLVGGMVGNAVDTRIKNAYAAGHLTGTTVGGLVGGGGGIIISNSYAAGTIFRASAEAGGLCAGPANASVSYAAVEYVDVPASDKVYGAVRPGSNNSCVNVYYLAKRGVNDSVEMANVTDVSGAEQLKKQRLSQLGSFAEGERATVKAVPYNLPNKAEGGERDPQLYAPYPYPTLSLTAGEGKVDIPHYGDWVEADMLRGIVAYYEQLETASGLRTEFNYYERNEDTSQPPVEKGNLNHSRTGPVYSDGYAFLSLSQLHEDGKEGEPVIIQVAIGMEDTLIDQPTTYMGVYNENCEPFVDDPDDPGDKPFYYAYALPNSAFGVPGKDEYYMRLRVKNEDTDVENNSLWFNPHFGRTAYNGYGSENPGGTPGVPEGGAEVPIAVRSVRQLNNIRKYFDVWTGFTQELDIDGSCYQGDVGTDAEGYLTVAGMRVTVLQADGTWAPTKAATLPADYRLSFTPIYMVESKNHDVSALNGCYDGGSRTIRALTINGYRHEKDKKDYAGLFYRVNKDGVLKNIRMEDCDVTGTSGDNFNAGTLVGRTNGTVSNCTVKNCSVTMRQGSDKGGHAGGLVGYVTGGTVENCGVYLEGEDVNALYDSRCVTGVSNAGGFVGCLNEGSIQYCYAAIKVSGKTAGGFAGALTGGTVSNCYAGGHTQNGLYPPDAPNVTGADNAGGFAGTWKNGDVSGLCYTTCSAATTDGKVDAFAVSSKTVPSGCYAGGDVIVNGAAVSASSHNATKAAVRTLAVEPEASRVAAHRYDSTLPEKYPHKLITRADGTAMPHYGDWYYKKGPVKFEWTPEPEVFEEADTTYMAGMSAKWNGDSLTLTIVTKGDGTTLANLFQLSGGYFTITSDLGYVMDFKAVSENNGFTTIYDDKGEKLCEITPSVEGSGANLLRTYEFTVSTKGLLYTEEINVGGYKQGYINDKPIKNENPDACEKKPIAAFQPGDVVEVDGNFNDWNNYTHQLLTHTPGDGSTGSIVGAAYGDGNTIYLHIRNTYSKNLVDPNYSGTLGNLPVFNFVMTAEGYPSWQWDSVKWGELLGQTYRDPVTYEPKEEEKDTYKPGIYELIYKDMDYTTWPFTVKGTYHQATAYVIIGEDGSQEIEMSINLDEAVGKENADKITRVKFEYGTAGGKLEIYRDPKE